MSTDSQRNSAFNAATNVKVHHARLEDIKQFTPEKLGHLQRGGIRNGAGRTEAQTQQMLDNVPPSQRAGVDGQSAAAKAKEYLADKDASHIAPHSKGGSSQPDNIKWEDKATNRARGDQPMTQQEQVRLDVKAQFDNLTGALKAGFQAAPRGAVIGAVTTAPFSMLRNGLRVVRGEISAQEAALETAKETAIGGGVGAVTAFTVTTVAVACPPIAIALSAVSPVLLAVGGAGMVYEFFKILDNHREQVRAYYQSITQQELQRLQAIEDQLAYEHAENLEFLARARAINDKITNQVSEPGIKGILKKYMQSVAIAKSLGLTSSDSPLIFDTELPLLPPES